ncbi:MAG: hypothetical protein RRA94_05565 [Bacteroidota bacterium]|nr:hypothetical protein [Bacteroidota bacterium]
MPTPEQILEGLQRISTQFTGLALLWHIAAGALLITLALGRRPSRRTLGVLLTLPMFSVSLLAWLDGNPFNGSIFAVLAIALLVIALRLPKGAVAMDRTWRYSAIAIIIFGWAYPHFQTGTGIWHYLLTAPLGLVPCPTLAMVIGITMLFGGLDSKSWSRVLGAAGILYGTFGAFRLGVTVDIVLLAAAILLFALPARAAQPSVMTNGGTAK